MSVKVDGTRQALCVYLPRAVAQLILSFGKARAEEADEVFQVFMDLMRVRIRQHPLLRTHRQVAALCDFWINDSLTSLSSGEDFPFASVDGNEIVDFPHELGMPYETSFVREFDLYVWFALKHTDPPAGCNCLVCQYYDAGDKDAREDWSAAWAARSTITNLSQFHFGCYGYAHEWHDCECRDCRD
jgi:hypothetical protein